MRKNLFLLLLLLTQHVFAQSGIDSRERPKIDGQQNIRATPDGRVWLLEMDRVDTELKLDTTAITGLSPRFQQLAPKALVWDKTQADSRFRKTDTDVPKAAVAGLVADLEVRAPQMSLASVRALTTDSSPPQLFLTDAGKQGLWYRVSAVSQTDNTGTVLTTGGIWAYVRAVGGEVLDTWFEITPDSTTASNQTKLQNAINASAGRRLVVTGAVYGVNGTLNLPSGITIVGKARLKVLADIPQVNLAGVMWPVLLANGKRDITIDGIDVDGNDKIASPIVFAYSRGCVMKNCEVQRYHGATVGGNYQASWGGYDVESSFIRYENNYVHDTKDFALHSFNSHDITLTGNLIDCAFNGYYTGGWCENVKLYSNHGFNVVDVVWDWEGGLNCLGFGNTATGFGIGGMTIYTNTVAGKQSDNLVFQGGSVHATQTYKKYRYISPGNWGRVDTTFHPTMAALNVYSMGRAQNAGYDGVKVKIDTLAGYALGHQLMSDTISTRRSVFYRNIFVESKAGFHSFLDSDNLTMEHCTFIGLPGAESNRGYLKEGNNAVIRNNIYRYYKPKTTYPALDVLVANGRSKSPTLIANNVFENCGELAVKITPSTSNPLWYAHLSRNDLGPEYTSNAGLTVVATGNGVRYSDQKLRYLLPEGATNLSNLIPYAGWYNIIGHLSIYNKLNGAHGSQGTLLKVTNRNAVFSALDTNADMNASVSGSTLTITRNSGVYGQPAAGYWNATLNTYNP